MATVKYKKRLKRSLSTRFTVSHTHVISNLPPSISLSRRNEEKKMYINEIYEKRKLCWWAYSNGLKFFATTETGLTLFICHFHLFNWSQIFMQISSSPSPFICFFFSFCSLCVWNTNIYFFFGLNPRDNKQMAATEKKNISI